MVKNKLYGAILGDLVGKPYEYNYTSDYSDINLHNPKALFTDDTLMTLASASFLLNRFNTIEEAYKDMGKRYEGDYYGKNFKKWIYTPLGTINDSYGNGCLMRISPFMYIENSLPLIIDSVMSSHKHEVSIRSVIQLYDAYHKIFNYDTSKANFHKFFKIEADLTIALCLQFFLNNEKSTQNRIIDIIKLGGDTDTNASIIGELSNYYQDDITNEDVLFIESKLDSYLLDILHEFNQKF